MKPPKKPTKPRGRQHNLRGITLKRLGDYCAKRHEEGRYAPYWNEIAEMFRVVAKKEAKLR